MRFIYCDTGLVNNLGHHANYCRLITQELKSRNITCLIFGHAQLVPDLRAEFGAQAHFRCSTYHEPARLKDPIAGWLRDYEIIWSATLQDLRSIGVQAGDLVYFSTVQPPQFRAALEWFNMFPVHQRPTMVLEFGLDPGVQIAPSTPGQRNLQILDPFQDPHGVLYRHTASFMNENHRSRFRLGTLDATVSGVFEALMRHPVVVLPPPHVAITDCLCRRGRRPVTVAVLGHQRYVKGYHLMPELCRLLLQCRSDLRLLIHNGAPGGMDGEQAALRTLARADPRLVLDERVADLAIWGQLLTRSDLILCPYDPQRYATAFSAVIAEAIANAIPVVVPAETAAAALLREFGSPHTEFTTWDVTSVFAATEQALDKFDVLAARAFAACSQWARTRGAKNLVNTLLGFPGAS
jgi:hypothetical protein